MRLSKVNWKYYDGQERKALHAHGVLNYAVMLHGVVILKYSSGRNQIPPCDWDAEACENAARNGHLEVLQWARNQSPPCDWDIERCLRVLTEETIQRCFECNKMIRM